MRSSLRLASALLIPALAAAGSARAEESPLEALRVDVRGMTFSALASGPTDGEVVILLHGFPQTSHAFRRLLPALAAAGFRAVAPDQRGYSPGARPEGVEAYRVGRLIEDVVGLADALGAARFHLVGHDWGGAVAWGVAGRHPERLLSLTVLSTPHPAALALARRESDQAERSSYMADLAAEGAEGRLLADGAAGLRRILGPPLTPQDREVYVRALGSPEALRGALAWYRALLAPAAPTATPAAAPRRVPVPTAYAWGTADPVFSPEAARATKSFVSGPCAVEAFEGIGHWLLESAPARVEALVLAHLARWSESGDRLGTRESYERARATLERSVAAAGGREAIAAAFPFAAGYAGAHLALGQGLAPDEPPERLDVAGRFVVDAHGRAFLEQQLVNTGGTDRTFRRVVDGPGGWNDWVPRRLLTEIGASDAAFLRGQDSLYPPRALPHAVLADALGHAASLRWLGARDEGAGRIARIGYADDDGRLLTLRIGESDRLAGVEQLAVDFERGDELAQVLYEAPGRVAGVEVPGRVSFRRGGEEVEVWTLHDTAIGADVDVSVFDRPGSREVTQPLPSFQPQEVADGVWMVRLYSGPANSYNTMLVEFDSFLAVMDAPLADAFERVMAGIAARLAPGKPIRYAIPTHAHADHIGGIRAYLAAGATAVATPSTAALLRRLPQARLTLRPDPLAATAREPSIEEFEGVRVIREGDRELRLYDVGPTPHAREIVAAWLPAERVLFVSDLFARPDNGRPAPPSATTEAFVERVEALGLDVGTVVAGHGLPTPWAEVRRTARLPRVTTPRLGDELPSSGRLGGVAVDARGHVFVANFRGSVWRIDPDGRVERLPVTLQGSSGNGVDAAGNLYQASFLDGRIVRVTPAGEATDWITEGLDGPVGVAAAADGTLYVCNCRGNSVVRVDPDRRARTLASGGDLDCPNGIALDAEGLPVVVSFNNGHVLRIAEGGVRRIATLPGSNAHVAVAGDALYVTQIRDNRVYRVDADGRAAPYAGIGAAGFDDGPVDRATLSRPNGIAATPDGAALIVSTLEGEWRTDRPTRIVLRRIELPPS